MTPIASTTLRSDARGYAMAVLLVAMAVMLTLMTVAMPVWRQQAKREREEELLFRLRQYAHALVLYQRRLPGAAPSSVDDLVKQRFLRKKYLDPMTGKDFAVLRVGQISPGMTTPIPAGGGRQNPTGGPGAPGTPAGTPQTPRLPGGPATTGATGPIRAVVSTSKESSLRSWKGRTQYDQWEVAIEDITPRFPGMQTPQPGQPQGPGGSRGPGVGGGGRGPGPGAGAGAGQGLPANPYGIQRRP